MIKVEGCYIQFHCPVSEHIQDSREGKNLNKDLQLKLHENVVLLGYSLLWIPDIVS